MEGQELFVSVMSFQHVALGDIECVMTEVK